MHSRAFFFNLSWIAGVVFGIYFLQSLMTHEDKKRLWSDRIYNQVSYSEYALEEEENPGARQEYEWLRHINPETKQVPLDIHTKELLFSSRILSYNDKGTIPFRLNKSAAQEWSLRGPFNIGGRTRALAIDISDPLENTLLAGGASGGMWRSINSGKSWSKTTIPDQLHSVTCIAQDTRSGKTHIWYYGTGELSGNSPAGGGGALYRGDGIFKSIDQGKTWQRLSSTVTNTPHVFDNPFDYVWNIAVDSTNKTQDEVYAATLGGIYRSVDGGISWQRVLGEGTNINRYTDVSITPSGVVYAALADITDLVNPGNPPSDQAGIFRSTDGINWVKITPPFLPSLHFRTVIGISISNDIVYFLTEIAQGFTQQFCLASYQHGLGWKNLSANLPAFGGEVGNFNSQNSYNMLIKVKPDDPQVVYVGGTNLYRSTDGFSSKVNTAWIGGYSPINNISVYLNHHPDQHALVFYNQSGKMLSGHDGGISFTEANLADPVKWVSLNNGYITSQFYTIAINPFQSNDEMLGGLQDNGTMATDTKNATTPWVRALSGDGSYAAISADGLHYYASTNNAMIYRFDFDETGKQTGFARIDPQGGAGYLFINPFVLDPVDDRIMYLAGGASVWRSNRVTDIPSGSNDPASTGWIKLSGTTTAPVSALGISSRPTSVLYYGTVNGKLYKLNDARTTTIAAKEITSTLFPKDGYISCVAVDPFDSDNVVVTFSNYEVISVFYSDDGGLSWSAIAGNLEEQPDGKGSGPSVHWASILYLDSGPVYFLGTSTGLYSTHQLSQMQTIWIREGAESIGNVVVDMMATRQTDGAVVIATHGNGVYSTHYLNAIPLTNRTDDLSFEMYPVPFKDELTIKYQLYRGVSVSLSIYDSFGRELSVLLGEYQKKGPYQFVWDGRIGSSLKVASGVYYIRFQAGDVIFCRRLIVLM